MAPQQGVLINVIVRYGRPMGAKLGTEVLLALLDVDDHGISGVDVQERLATRTKRPAADAVLVSLLRLEAAGHVAVERGATMRFALTPAGRDRAYELGGGQ